MPAIRCAAESVPPICGHHNLSPFAPMSGYCVILSVFEVSFPKFPYQNSIYFHVSPSTPHVQPIIAPQSSLS